MGLFGWWWTRACPSPPKESDFFGTLTTSGTTEPPWHIQEHRETPSCQDCFPFCSQLAPEVDRYEQS